MLAVVSLLSYVIGYTLGYDNPFSASLLLMATFYCVACILFAALPIAMIETNLRRSWKDAACWAAIPASLFLIGFVVEIARYGFD